MLNMKKKKKSMKMGQGKHEKNRVLLTFDCLSKNVKNATLT